MKIENIDIIIRTGGFSENCVRNLDKRNMWLHEILYRMYPYIVFSSRLVQR